MKDKMKKLFIFLLGLYFGAQFHTEVFEIISKLYSITENSLNKVLHSLGIMNL